MNQRDWQNAYGNAPEDFHLRLVETLDGLEEKKMKKRYKFSTVLIAAVIMALLLAGGAVAASQLGVFHLLTHSAAPIVPLEGAEKMVVTELGSTENDLVSVTVEEAVFDGQVALAQLRLQSKDPDHYVLFDAFMQDAPEDVYITENEQVGENEYEFRVIGRRDGKQCISYSILGMSADESFMMDTADVKEQEDGSLIYWMQGNVNGALDADTLDFEIRAAITLDGERISLDPIAIQIPKAGEMRHAKLIPVSEPLERVEIVNGEISFTRLEGQITVGYLYEQLPEELMGITFHFYDAEGNAINTGNGEAWDADGLNYWRIEIQSFDELPDRIWIEPKVIDGDPLDRIECKVIEE